MPAADRTYELFVRYPKAFLAIHEHAWPSGGEETRDLVRILERLGIAPGAHVLDAPCGIGRHATRLAKRGYRVVSVDLSRPYVARANEPAGVEGAADPGSHHVGDLRNLRRARPKLLLVTHPAAGG